MIPSSQSSPTLRNSGAEKPSFADRSTQLALVTEIIHLLLVVLILSAFYSFWQLVSPFSAPLLSSIILATALREPSDLKRLESFSKKGIKNRNDLHDIDLDESATSSKGSEENSSSTMLLFRRNDDILGEFIFNCKSSFHNYFCSRRRNKHNNKIFGTALSWFEYFLNPWIAIPAVFLSTIARPSSKNLPSFSYYSPPTSVLIKILGIRKWPFLFTSFDALPLLVQTVLCVGILVVTTARLLQFLFHNFATACLVASLLHLSLSLVVLSICILWNIIFGPSSSSSSGQSSQSTTKNKRIIKQNNSNNNNQTHRRRHQQETNLIRSAKMLNTVGIAIVISVTYVLSVFNELDSARKKSIINRVQVDNETFQTVNSYLPSPKEALSWSLGLSENATDEIEDLLTELKEGMFLAENITSNNNASSSPSSSSSITPFQVLSKIREQITDLDSFLWIYVPRIFQSNKLDLTSKETKQLQHNLRSAFAKLIKFIWESISWVTLKFGEILLFLSTLSALLRLERTAIYYVVEKILRLVLHGEEEAHAAAHRTELFIVRELNRLFYGLMHKFVFQFLCTLFWYSIFDMPLSVTISAAGAFLALFNSGRLNPIFLQIIIGSAVMLVKGSFDPGLLIFGFVFLILSQFVSFYGGNGRRNHHHHSHHRHRSKNVSHNNKQRIAIDDDDEDDEEDNTPVVNSVNEAFKRVAKRLREEGIQLLRKQSSSSNNGNNATNKSSSAAKTSGRSIKEGTYNDNPKSSTETSLEKLVVSRRQDVSSSSDEKISEYLIATSIILGIYNQGALGILSGPAISIAAQGLSELL